VFNVGDSTSSEGLGASCDDWDVAGVLVLSGEGRGGDEWTCPLPDATGKS
jgi:hypothetical protein